MQTVKNILFITPEYPWINHPEGGLANYIRKTAAALNQRKFNAYVLAVTGRNLRWIDGNTHIYEVGLPFNNLQKNIANFLPVLGLVYWLLLLIKIRRTYINIRTRIKLDLVQTSSYKFPALLIPRSSTPLICRISSISSDLRKAYGTMDSWVEKINDLSEKYQIDKADTLFAPSSLLAKKISRTNKKCQVIHSPMEAIDKSHLDWSLYKQKLYQKKYLLHFGTLSRIKGTDLISSIINPICRNHRDIHFVFIGRDDGIPGGEKFTDIIRRQNSEYLHRIIFLPPLSKNDLLPIVKKALVVLMPSRIDNYPNTCLEAMQVGTPVIGSRGSSIDEIIRDGYNGLLVENNSSRDLYRKINQYLDTSVYQKSKFRHNCLAYTRLFHKHDYLGQLIKFYEQTISTFQHPA